MCFFGSAAAPNAVDALKAVEANRACFDDERASFFGVSIDPLDQSLARVRESMPGIRFIWDSGGAVSRSYGAISVDASLQEGSATVRMFWIVLDPTLRVMKVFPFDKDGQAHAALFAYLKTLPPPHLFAGFEVPAPILVIPNAFEPVFCRQLIELYKTHGGRETGVMREVDGKTVEVRDASHKRRKDYVIDDPKLIEQTQMRVIRRIKPELMKIFAFNASRMERYLVSCYAADDGGHFRPHRDNTTKGTAHRRFAVSINLNDAFEGGELSFPEYGPRTYKAPVGAAIVFPCALLHEVSKVTGGQRYAFLPFLYDDEAAKLRERNSQFLAEDAGVYKASITSQPN
jgi:predicted 2-oxoglutarate/Fe(II)-dependent dioxygenase YbiX/peroxiredoxin